MEALASQVDDSLIIVTHLCMSTSNQRVFMTYHCWSYKMEALYFLVDASLAAVFDCGDNNPSVLFPTQVPESKLENECKLQMVSLLLDVNLQLN